MCVCVVKKKKTLNTREICPLNNILSGWHSIFHCEHNAVWQISGTFFILHIGKCIPLDTTILRSAFMGLSMSGALWKIIWRFLRKLKTEPPEGPAIPPAGTRKWSSLRLALGTKCARPWQIRVTSGQSWWVGLHRGEQFHAWPLRGKSLFKSFGEGFFSFFPPQRNEKILLRHEHVKTQQSRGNDDCYMSPHWEKKSTWDQTLWYFQASQQWFQRAFYGSVGIVAWDDICMY